MTTIQDWLAALSGGDLPEDAVSGSRCLLPPIGCGRPLAEDALTEVEAREWHISGLCPTCFDAAAPDEGDAPCSGFVPDAPRAPGLCATCGDSRAWHQADGRLAEQQHLLDPNDAAFALLAVQHPDRCHTAADYPAWTAGGAA